MEPAQGRTEANGLEFAFLEAGSGPLALCLHGFPDAAPTWRHLLPALADAGYHAVAPWLRGYAPTDVPPDGRYQSGALAADAVALHEALGGDGDAVIIGHDWGAAATYGAAALAPDRWRRVVTMAVPPTAAFGAGLMRYQQLRRSWYFFFFQSPLADMVVPMNDLEFIERLWEDWSPGYDHRDDTPAVKDALRDPANLAAAIGYYRAAFGTTPPDPALAEQQAAMAMPTPQPLLYLHGADDGCIGADIAAGVPDAVIVEGTGHFLHLEKPDEVNRRVVEFLAS